MRVLKFRQANKNNKQVYYWGLVNNEWIRPLIQPNYIHPEKSDQYTGLKDRNGKEIYEGDSFKYYPYQSLPEIGNVIFKDACFIYNICGDEYMLSELNNQIEIIGNIHENKDLL